MRFRSPRSSRWRSPAWAVSLALLAALPAATGREAAELAPSNTIAMFGWSQFLDPGAESTKRAREAFERFVRVIAQEDNRDLQFLHRVIPVVLDAGSGTGALALVDLPVSGDAVRPGIAMVIAGMQAPERLAELVRDLLAEDEKPSTPVKLGDANLSVATPPNEVQKLYYGVYRNVFLAVMGESTANKILELIRGNGQTLASTPEYRESVKAIERYAPAEQLVGFVNIQRAIAAGRDAAVAVGGSLPPNLDAILDEVGLAGMQSVHWRHGAADERMAGVTYLRTHPGADKGLVKALRQKPLDMNLLALPPADAYWACASALDLNECWREAMRVLNAIAPEAAGPIEGSLSSARNVLGFSPTEDLLPNLGREWLFFDAPDHGSLLFTGTVIVLKPTDPQALHDIVSRVGELLSPFLNQARSELRQIETQFSDKTIYTWLAAGLPSPIAPSWTQVEGRTAFALFPQTLATVLKRVDPKTRNNDLNDNKEFMDAIADWPKELTGITYVDSRAVGRKLYPLWSLFQTTICSLTHEAGKPIDLRAFPTLPDMVESMRCTVGGVWHDANGIYSAYRGSSGIMEQLLFSPAAVMGLIASTAVPAFAEAHQTAQQAKTNAYLREVGMACHMYAADHADRFPPNLEALVKAGHVDASRIEDLSYIHGQTTSDAANNVLAYRFVEDEGVIILFLDGHVDHFDREGFTQVVRQTYQNLNRTNELPPEFQETRTPTELPD